MPRLMVPNRPGQVKRVKLQQLAGQLTVRLQAGSLVSVEKVVRLH